ncbi:non-ribosomal peptide synthetase [Mucilaginibacter sp. 21P]|uniref:non-ribosomal peptide synthetase n=1 Tax=Mucilaginibacter sp. 21P TaxID=2778902 RepID=UPI001C55CCEC|nr:non-ribosomal peptide synthetase [Mucilaginibacter sp. 21P]QXV63878.1 non-ribosomal peptide synthetase [Mucilaginibacter sp. 21P]
MNNNRHLQKLINDYWLNKLQHAEKYAVVAAETRFEQIEKVISSAYLQDLFALANNNEMAEFIVLIVAYGVLLEKFLPAENRIIALPGFKGVDRRDNHVLFFELSAHATDTFKTLLQHAKLEVGKIINHADFDYSELAGEFINRDIDENDIFSFAFCYDSVHTGNGKVSRSAFHLSVQKSPAGDLNLSLAYNAGIVDPFIASQILNYYEKFITGVRSNLDTAFEDITLLSHVEQDTLISSLAFKENEQSLVALFNAQVQNSPDGIALKAGNITYTYQQLDEITDRLASYLLSDHDVKPDQLITIVVSKTEWAIIGILGILKSGAAFVPIEPSQPKERINHIIQDCGTNILMLESEQMFDYDWFTGSIIVTDIQADTLPFAKPAPLTVADTEALAYVIYTSGTTGMPKGVMINRSSVVNYASSLIKKFDLGTHDGSVMLASLAFDLGYTSFWGTLLAGGTLHLLPFDYATKPDETLYYLIDNQIRFIKTTPSFFYMLTHVPGFRQTAPSLSLRLVLLGGEAIRKDDIEWYRLANNQTEFANHYGPTEATIGCVFNLLGEDDICDPYTNQPIIGQPIDNSQVLIVDEKGRMVAPGVTGELWVTGNPLARGYLNATDQNNTKFLWYPGFNGLRVYKTGDYGKLNKENKIVFCGRKDSQVKIRGYRVELSEIRSKVLATAGVTDAVIVYDVSGAAGKLIAYYQSEIYIAADKFIAAMQQNLPTYMLPEYFVKIAYVPLTANGKLDLKKLPLPENTSDLNDRNILPRNETEEVILKAWIEVLNKQPIGVNVNFFDIGGNSLLLVKVSTILSEFFPDLTIVDLFNYTSIEKLAAFLTNKKEYGVVEVKGQTITFPENYLNRGYKFRTNNMLLKVPVIGQSYHEIAQAAQLENVDVTDILIGMFAYVLFEICGQKDIVLHTVKNNEQFYFDYLQVDFNAINDPQTLFAEISRQQKAINATVPFKQIDEINFADRKDNQLVVFVYEKDVLPLMDTFLHGFDIKFEIDRTSVGSIQCQFDYGVALNPGAMDKLVTQYFENLSAMLKLEA